MNRELMKKGIALCVFAMLFLQILTLPLINPKSQVPSNDLSHNSVKGKKKVSFPKSPPKIIDNESSGDAHSASILQDKSSNPVTQNVSESKAKSAGSAQPIRINISRPTNGSLISGAEYTVKLRSNLTVNDATFARLLVNDSKLRTWTGKNGSFTYGWNTTTYEDGWYNLTFWANDTNGQTNEPSNFVRIINPVKLYNETGLVGRYTTIQKAVDRANPNDTILVNSTYNSTEEEFPIELNVYNLTVKTGAGQKAVVNGSNKKKTLFKIKRSHITLEGFTITGGNVGVELVNFPRNTISGNTIMGNVYGISVDSSDHRIKNNNVTSNNIGILIGQGENNTVEGNTISKNSKKGLYLESTTGNVIVNNTMNHNTVGFIVEGNTIEQYNHTIRNNSVGGSKARYYFNKNFNGTNKTFNGTHLTFAYCNNFTIQDSHVTEGDFLRLVNSENATILNTSLRGNVYGIRIESSKNITVMENNITSNGQGISVINSNNTTIMNNNLMTNKRHGFYARNMRTSTISVNDFSNNSYAILLNSSVENELLDNSLIRGGNYGIYFTASDHNEVKNNSIKGREYGIYLHSSSENSIKANLITRGDYPIYLKNASNNRFEENKLKEATKYGICLRLSDRNKLINNNISINETLEEQLGVYLSFSSNNLARGNTITSNGAHGVYFSFSRDNTFKNNAIMNASQGIILYHSSGNALISNNISSKENGIYLYYSDDVEVNDNTIKGNAGDGLYLKYSNHVAIIHNVIANNEGNGLYFYHGEGCKVSNNKIRENRGDGIYLRTSEDNEISRNHIRSNGGNGIQLFDASENILSSNDLLSNGGYGALLEHANDNLITRNKFEDNEKGSIHTLDSTENTLTGNDIPGKEDERMIKRPVLIAITVLMSIALVGILVIVKGRK